MSKCKRPDCNDPARLRGYCDSECEAMHERDIAEAELAALRAQLAEAQAKLAAVRNVCATRIDRPGDQPNWADGRIAGFNQAIDMVEMALLAEVKE